MAGQVIWIMGLSGAGKTTLANELTARLRQGGLQPILLDGGGRTVVAAVNCGCLRHT